MLKKFMDKPFKLMSVIGSVYLLISILINVFTEFGIRNSIFPYSDLLYCVFEGIALILCVLTFFFFNNHYLYYAGIEIVVFINLYVGNIYTSLFLSSLLLVFLITENKIVPGRNLIIYTVLEIAKIAFVIPYGVAEFFNYVGLDLFALCTIGCVNLLFRHAYDKKETTTICLDDYKFSERQKTCIKEIVVNNTTIKALSLTFNVSESAIKKDLAYIYKTFGITGKADLKALFIGYKF